MEFPPEISAIWARRLIQLLGLLEDIVWIQLSYYCSATWGCTVVGGVSLWNLRVIEDVYDLRKSGMHHCYCRTMSWAWHCQSYLVQITVEKWSHCCTGRKCKVEWTPSYLVRRILQNFEMFSVRNCIFWVTFVFCGKVSSSVDSFSSFWHTYMSSHMWSLWIMEQRKLCKNGLA